MSCLTEGDYDESEGDYEEKVRAEEAASDEETAIAEEENARYKKMPSKEDFICLLEKSIEKSIKEGNISINPEELLEIILLTQVVYARIFSILEYFADKKIPRGNEMLSARHAHRLSPP